MIDAYKHIPAKDRDQAIVMARALCQCVRQSMLGVWWREEHHTIRMTWAEIDAARV